MQRRFSFMSLAIVDLFCSYRIVCFNGLNIYTLKNMRPLTIEALSPSLKNLFIEPILVRGVCNINFVIFMIFNVLTFIS